MTASHVIAVAALAFWLYLLSARGGFWRASVREDGEPSVEPGSWPSVSAVVPARDEADSIGASLRSLLAQDYPGSFDVILVDDQSRDGTAEMAAKTATDAPAHRRLTILAGAALPAGWTGKIWAVKQGVGHAENLVPPPRYLLLTDADIAFAGDALRRLVARAEAQGLVLTSLMAKLRCDSMAERCLVPAFVFFFQMLYPFAWVNRAGRTAAAAGGCMLVRLDALREAGGIEAIRDSLIDDCALAKRLKPVGPIWLGLTDRVRSLRPYPHVSDVGRMVSRSAYDQLNYSPALLAGTVAAMALAFVAPPLLALFGSGLAQGLGALAWALMALAFQPMLRFYRVSPFWGVILPAIASAYMVFTLSSAWQHARGRGGLWKGRTHARVSGLE